MYVGLNKVLIFCDVSYYCNSLSAAQLLRHAALNKYNENIRFWFYFWRNQ